MKYFIQNGQIRVTILHLAAILGRDYANRFYN